MMPVALPSPDYIPGPEEPQTPPAPQDEDEHELMVIQPHDPDFVPELIYPEYIPLEDDHILPAKEQPLPPVVSPTTQSPGYVAKSDPEEDPEEYEEDEAEDGPVDHPMDGGDDRDDDDGNSSRYDADDEDEDEEEGEEEEHSLPYHHPLLTRPPPLELGLLSEHRLPYPFHQRQRERLARCTAPAALPSLRLPPYSYPPPLVDLRDDIPKSEQPPRKRLCLATLGSREVGYGIRDTWIDPAEAVPDMASTTLVKVNTRVTELVKLHKHDTQDLYALPEDAQDGVPTSGTPGTATVAEYTDPDTAAVT
uniref:Uncharacterized protein n=1 Tax=Tanacetum cinerariifolium TaxID=118510 RepID=A0A699HYG8_TANCI|nr:hypothetical protein [Tanacetum cinerariifolium]